MVAKSECKKIANEKKIELIVNDLKVIIKRKKDGKIIGISISKSENMIWEDCFITLKDIYHIGS